MKYILIIGIIISISSYTYAQNKDTIVSVDYYNSLIQRNDNYSQDISEIELDIENLNNEKIRIESSIENALSLTTELSIKILSLKKELQNYKDSINIYNSLTEKINLDSLNKIKKQHKADLNKINDSITNVKQQIREKQKKLCNLEELEKKYSKLIDDKKNLQQRFTFLEQERKNKQSELATLQNINYDREIENLQNNKNAFINKIKINLLIEAENLSKNTTFDTKIDIKNLKERFLKFNSRFPTSFTPNEITEFNSHLEYISELSILYNKCKDQLASQYNKDIILSIIAEISNFSFKNQNQRSILQNQKTLLQNYCNINNSIYKKIKTARGYTVRFPTIVQNTINETPKEYVFLIIELNKLKNTSSEFEIIEQNCPNN